MSDVQHQAVDPGTPLSRLTPWIPEIALVTARTEEDPFRVISLMYVESWCGWAPGYTPKGDPNGWGDGGHAFGFFQIDKRYHAAFIARPDAGSVDAQARYAISLLQANRTSLRRIVSGDLLERSVYAAYNGPLGMIYSGLKHGADPDSFTTGKDYAARIWKEAEALRASKPEAFNASNLPETVG